MLATAGLATAYAKQGVRVVGLNPGLTETGRVAEGLASDARLAGISIDEARARGIDTGLAQGHAICAAIIGSSLRATKLSNSLFAGGINVQPIIHPAVEEKAARLRFFLSADHTPEQLRHAAQALADRI